MYSNRRVVGGLGFGFEKSAPSPVPASTRLRCRREQARAAKTVTLSAARLAKLPRAEIEVGKKHRKYAGVPLAELLRAASVEWGGKCSPLLMYYVLVEGSDGYSVLFSIPEIDPQQRHQMVILADRCDGKPLPSSDGPYQTIEEDAKQHGRWVKHAKSHFAAGGGPPPAAFPRTTTAASPAYRRRLSMSVSVRCRPCPCGLIVLAVVGVVAGWPAGGGGGPAGRAGKIYLVGMGPGDADLVNLQGGQGA